VYRTASASGGVHLEYILREIKSDKCSFHGPGGLFLLAQLRFP